MILTLIRMGWRQLMAAKRRTFLLGGALAAVALFFTLILALIGGVYQTMMTGGTVLSSGHVNVAGFYKAKASDATPLVTNFANVKKIALEHVEDVDYVVDRGRGWAKVISETHSLYAGIHGITASEEKKLLTTLVLAPESDYKKDGRHEVLGSFERLSDEHHALIFAAQAKRLGVTVGDKLTLMVETMNGQTDTGEVIVAAVAKDVGMMSNWSVFVHKNLLRQLYQLNTDTSGALMIYLKNPDRAETVMKQLRDVFNQQHYAVMPYSAQPFFMKFETVAAEDWLGQKLDFTTWQDESGMLKWILNVLMAISIFLTVILLMIVGVGIMNAMWVSIRERTSEIGTLRAIGMYQRQVLLMFASEAMLLGCLSSTLGVLFGVLAMLVMNMCRVHIATTAIQMVLMTDTLTLSLAPWMCFATVLGFTLFTGMAALWPSLRASRMSPTTAIAQVG